MSYVKIKFTVNRKRDGWDNEPQVLECIVSRPRSFAEEIDYHYDDTYKESSYDRFCNQVPNIVSAIHGVECGRDWYFDRGPVVVK